MNVCTRHDHWPSPPSWGIWAEPGRAPSPRACVLSPGAAARLALRAALDPGASPSLFLTTGCASVAAVRSCGCTWQALWVLWAPGSGSSVPHCVPVPTQCQALSSAYVEGEEVGVISQKPLLLSLPCPQRVRNQPRARTQGLGRAPHSWHLAAFWAQCLDPGTWVQTSSPLAQAESPQGRTRTWTRTWQ